jgi:hypothetical protein
MKVASEVEKILKGTVSRVQDLADLYRERVLVPFCRKHHLTYIAGMGRTVFYDSNDRPVDSLDIRALKKIEVDLNVEVLGTNDVFGYYISDITEQDIA